MARMSRSVDAALIALAIASRIAAVWVLQSHLVPRSTYEHGEIAANLLAGRGFAIKFLGADGPTSQQAPVYPAIRRGRLCDRRGRDAAIIAPLGIRPIRPGRPARSGRLAFVPVDCARRPLMAWTAGLIVALHPTLVYAATHVQVAISGSDPADLGAGLGLPDRVERHGSRCRDHRWPPRFPGFDRPDSGLSMVGVAWAIWQAGADMPGDRRRSLGLIAVVAIVALVGIAPWLVRNFVDSRRVRGDQEHVRLRILAGKLRLERGNRQGRAALGRTRLGSRSNRARASSA